MCAFSPASIFAALAPETPAVRIVSNSAIEVVPPVILKSRAALCYGRWVKYWGGMDWFQEAPTQKPELWVRKSDKFS
ncbi:MAG: hypothetical protein ACJA1F_003324 [Paracoccaceae bacterium]|jgi:hypothetical protein